MPCIPDPRELRELQAEAGIRAWRNTLEKLLPSCRRFLPVVEALLAERPELAQREDVQLCLARMKQLAAYQEAPAAGRDVDALESEAANFKYLAHTAESALCDAGTLAWNAAKDRSDRPAALQALLDRHQQHREEDRRARLRQLRSEVSAIKKQLAQERKRTLEPEFGERTALPTPRADFEAATAGVRSALEARERRIAEIKALSVDAICSNRFVF